MRPIQIGSRLIGPGSPCFIAAEIGINHNGNIELAKKSIDAALKAGADAVKFQNYRTEDFISDESLTYTYESKGQKVTESQYDMFKRYELTDEQLLEIKSYCDRIGTVFFSTPTGKEGIDLLVKIESPLLKNGSDYLTHLPIIRAMAQTGIPTVLSTGMSTLSEIDDAVREFYNAGGKDLILLHCTSLYPTPAEDVNLSRIPTLGATFGCPIGFSDHTRGTTAAIGSVSLGACYIEKHFTLDRNLPGPDHCFSSDFQEMQELVNTVRTVEKNLGTSLLGPSRSEDSSRNEFRLSCVAARNLERGQLVAEEDIRFCRPGSGLPPKALRWLVGRRLGRDVKKGATLLPEDFV